MINVPSPPTEQTPNTPENTVKATTVKKQSDSKENDITPKRTFSFNKLPKFFESIPKWVYVAAGITAGVFAICGNIASIVSIGIIEKQFRISNRPYFALVDVPPVRFIPGERIETKICLKNVGNTPAFKVNVLAQIESIIGDFKIPPKYGTTPRGPSNAIIAQQDTATIKIFTNGPATINIIEALKNGETKLYVFCRIEYDDIFKDHHTTTFCSVFRISENDFVFCGFYNEDDQ